jgi:hypothetical protein
VQAYLEGKTCIDYWHRERGAFLPQQPPTGSHVGIYSDEVVLECPHLVETANDPRVLAAVGRVLGCLPTLSNLSLWWSFSGPATPEQDQLFHRDVDDIKFLKLFVHLTDVGPDAGAHVFVRTSHRSGRLSRIRRYSDAEIEAAFGRENLVEVTGPAGTSFLEDTFGFHKGKLPTAGQRLMFHAQYSLLPIGIGVYTARRLPRAPGCRLHPYVNRLYLELDGASGCA